MTTESAPSGIGAPVMIRIAVPSPTGILAGAPAATSPTTRNEMPCSECAPDVSTARTAYPSTAELAKGGTSSGDSTSCAKTNPVARSTLTLIGADSTQAANTRRRASPIGINALVADGDAESFGDTPKTVQDRERKTSSSRHLVQGR